MLEERELLSIIEDYASGCGGISGEDVGRSIVDCVNNYLFSGKVFLDYLVGTGSMHCKVFFTELGWEFFGENYKRLVVTGMYDERNKGACLGVKELVEVRDLGVGGKYSDITAELVLIPRYLHQKVYDLFKLWFDEYC